MMIKQIFLLFILTLSVVSFTQNNVNSAPGDSLGEAIQVTVGTYTGQFTSIYDNFFYNLTASSLQTYNITLSHSNFSDAPLRVFSFTGSELSVNNSIYTPKNIIISGYSHYSIRFYTSEFTDPIPDDYTLIISLVETEEGKSLNNAFIANEGTQSSTLISYNDYDLYNFTGEATKIYNFTLSHSSETYYSLYIYDSEMNLIARNFEIGDMKYLLLFGNSKYVIGIFASEFSTTPNPYELIITEIPQIVTDVSTVFTTETYVDERVTIQTSLVTRGLVSFPALTIVFVFPFVMLVRRSFKH